MGIGVDVEADDDGERGVADEAASTVVAVSGERV
jgi:hypothetical protein